MLLKICKSSVKRDLSEHVSKDEPSMKKARIDHKGLDADTESILNGAKLTDFHVMCTLLSNY